MPLIAGDQTFALSAFFFSLVAFGLWMEHHRIGQHLGGPLVLLALAMLAANVGLVPHSAPLYGSVMDLLVPLAIPLLLLRADLGVILRESGPMLLLFALAAAATLVGVLVATQLVDLGDDTAAVAATITASYIGGSLNFVATAEALGLRDSALYVSALSADAVGGVFFLLLLMLLPVSRWVRRALPSVHNGAVPGQSQAAGAETAQERGEKEEAPFALLPAVNGLALSFVICAVSAAIAGWLGHPAWFVLLVTALTLLVANTAGGVTRHVASEFEIGRLFMYLFFAVIGASADISAVIGTALPLVVFVMIVVLIHLALLLLVGWWFKLDLAEVMVASNACILGPPAAAALAASREWHALVAPGMLVGMLGYVVGTFLGIGVGTLIGY